MLSNLKNAYVDCLGPGNPIILSRVSYSDRIKETCSLDNSIPCLSHNIELCFYAQTYSKEIFPEREATDIIYKNTVI